MRIISDFHDYYDTVLSYGQDQSVIYHRKTKTIEGNDVKKVSGDLFECLKNFPPSIPARTGCGFLDLGVVIIGFCGKVNVFPYTGLLEVAYKDNIVDLIVNKYPELKKKDILFEVNKKPADWCKFGNSFTLNGFKKYKEYVESINFSSVFLDNKSPIFVAKRINSHRYGVNGLTLEINPKLGGNLKFQKVKSPYEAFQEIYSFISTVLVEDKIPNENIPDSIKIAKRGFDKNSFRKMKSTS